MFKLRTAAVGVQLISLYFMITYIVPLIAQTFFEKNMQYVYKVYPLSGYVIFMLGASFLLFLLLENSKFSLSHKVGFIKLITTNIAVHYIRYRWLFSLFLLGIAIANIFFQYNLNQYRYSHLSIIQHDSILLMLIIMLTPIATVDLFYTIFVKEKDDKVNLKSRLEQIALSVSLFLLANGVATAFIAFIVLFYSFSPKLFDFTFFERGEEGKQVAFLKKVMFSCGSIFVFMCLFVFAWFYGSKIKNDNSVTMIKAFYHVINPSDYEKELFREPMQKDVNDLRLTQLKSSSSDKYCDIEFQNKVNSNAGFTREGFDAIFNYMFYVIKGISTSYYTLLFTSQAPRPQLNNGEISPLVFPMKTFLYRLNYLIGGHLDVDRPEIASISQLNYRLLVKRMIHEREGSSPGLLGAFNYVFVFPFNIFFCVLYLRFISGMVNTLIGNDPDRRLRIAGLIVLLLFFHVFFESPFDLLEIIDNCVIYIILLTGVFLHKVSVASAYVNNEKLSFKSSNIMNKLVS